MLGPDGRNEGITQFVLPQPAAMWGNTEATVVTVQKTQRITDDPVCGWRALVFLGGRR